MTLVLDETYDDLDLSDYTHFTNVINIKIYRRQLLLKQYFPVTKVWTLEGGRQPSVGSRLQCRSVR